MQEKQILRRRGKKLSPSRYPQMKMPQSGTVPNSPALMFMRFFFPRSQP